MQEGSSCHIGAKLRQPAEWSDSISSLTRFSRDFIATLPCFVWQLFLRMTILDRRSLPFAYLYVIMVCNYILWLDGIPQREKLAKIRT